MSVLANDPTFADVMLAFGSHSFGSVVGFNRDCRVHHLIVLGYGRWLDKHELILADDSTLANGMLGSASHCFALADDNFKRKGYYMKRDLFELGGLNEQDIYRIEKTLKLHEGTINTEAAPPRASDNGDFFIKIGFVDHGKKYL